MPESQFSYKLISDIVEEPINEGELYINVIEVDLVTLIERIMLLDFKIGEQVEVNLSLH